MHHSNPYQTLVKSVRSNAPAPAVTFYDGAERIELSYKSLENWVAKTSNFLIDEIDVDADDAIYLDLPAHWLKVVWMLAIWASGCQVASTRSEANHKVSSSPIEGDDIYCSLQVMGKRPAAPEGFLDFVTEVRRFSDFFSPTDATTEIDYADHWRLPEFSRILVLSEDLSQEQIAAALDSKSSLVILRNANEEIVEATKRNEKITHTWG